MNREADRRAAAVHVVHKFCATEGLPLPPHVRERRLDDRVEFIGTAPDGRQYGIAYELERKAP